MVSSVIIIALSATMLVVWFRFMISVTLSARTAKDFGTAVAREHQLSYQRVQADDGESALGLLARDYQVLQRLLKANVIGATLEERLLMIDYRMMAVWHRVAARISPAHARSAVAEMVGIVGYLANAVGERSASTM